MSGGTRTRLGAALDVLNQAHRECIARAKIPSDPLDDRVTWHFDAHLVWLAAEALRDAIDPLLLPPDPVQPALGLEPLDLLEEAIAHLLDLPDALGNPPLVLAARWTQNALMSVRQRHA